MIKSVIPYFPASVNVRNKFFRKSVSKVLLLTLIFEVTWKVDID